MDVYGTNDVLYWNSDFMVIFRSFIELVLRIAVRPRQASPPLPAAVDGDEHQVRHHHLLRGQVRADHCLTSIAARKCARQSVFTALTISLAAW